MISFELSAIDRHFAAFICRQTGNSGSWLRLVVSLASNSVYSGHICLNLAELAGREILVDGELHKLPAIDVLQRSLADTGVIGKPGDLQPLVLDGEGRLYLYRYWKYERDLAGIILGKAAAVSDTLDGSLLKEGLDRLFPDTDGCDWQQIAAVAALRKRFCVISGGPGTGKTSTVVKIIVLLLEQAKGAQLRIAMAAPTGKSAARLGESVRLMKEKLHCSAEIRSLIPDGISTIHRLLGSMGGSVRFRYSADNLLPFDVVIVDEASMVALPLMAKLTGALKSEARLILLGDRDQLASVEAGAVLGDICGAGRNEPFSTEFADYLAKVTGCGQIPVEPSVSTPPSLCDSLVILKKNYRFGDLSGIGEVGRAVNSGAGETALALLREELRRDVDWHDVPGPDALKKELVDTVGTGYRSYLAAATPAEALRLFDEYRILCALRQGPYGVEGINSLVEGILAAKGLINTGSRWYKGRPVMITVNDYNLKLFNGDVGIIFPDPESGGNPRAYFPTPDGGVRKISPVRLPAHETVYAMTIHKSQGSEFERILLLLPAHDSEVITRELIYTGITRAKSAVVIWGDGQIFAAAVARKIERNSGLKDALWI
jgi:exodeoxyribonuclease V alpha subunit